MARMSREAVQDNPLVYTEFREGYIDVRAVTVKKKYLWEMPPYQQYLVLIVREPYVVRV